MKKFTRGFTLIELLVVIAIIGILASIVLVSLNGARQKGSDTRVVADVQQMRTALETGFNGSIYPDLNSSNNANCNAAGATINAGATFANCVLAPTTAEGALNTDASAQGGALYISTFGQTANNQTNAYAIRGKLVSQPTKYFCIDSTGATNSLDDGANSGNPARCH